MKAEPIDVLFEEQQPMRQPWVWILVLANSLMLIGSLRADELARDIENARKPA